MKPIEMSSGIYQLSVDVQDILFEGMWDIPRGVTVNSYIVKGEKTAIIDGVCGWDGTPESLLKMLEEMAINPKDIDYLVVSHMEPDHSGWIGELKKLTNDFQIVCTKKAAALMDLFTNMKVISKLLKKAMNLILDKGVF